MKKLITNYLRNAVRAQWSGSIWFEPLLPTLYVTPMCNLRCTYCDDFGAHRNDGFRGQVLPLQKMKRLLDLLSEEAEALYLTGGEPTMRPDLVDILAHARAQGFLYLAMNTNGLLIRDHSGVLDLLDQLVISVDSLESGRWDSVLANRPDQVAKLLDNVRWVASQQRPRGFTLTVTCVVTPGRVQAARQVRDFCFSIGANFSAQHLSNHRIPSAELAQEADYQRFLDELLAAKRRGLPISGSELYLTALKERTPYSCTPTAAPHVDWLGRLAFPCRQLPDHVLVDMLEAGSYKAALAEGVRRYGQPPQGCNRCGERCYVEISSLVRRPTALAREAAGYLYQAGVARMRRSDRRDIDGSAPAPSAGEAEAERQVS